VVERVARTVCPYCGEFLVVMARRREEKACEHCGRKIRIDWIPLAREVH
jgi:uncharacterized protein YbaR (Trm112 family)